MAGCLSALVAGVAKVALAQEIVLEPQRLSEHCWFFQGEAGMASLANKGFMSNAGFVVTDAGVVVFDALIETVDNRYDRSGFAQSWLGAEIVAAAIGMDQFMQVAIREV